LEPIETLRSVKIETLRSVKSQLPNCKIMRYLTGLTGNWERSDLCGPGACHISQGLEAFLEDGQAWVSAWKADGPWSKVGFL